MFNLLIWLGGKISKVRTSKSKISKRQNIEKQNIEKKNIELHNIEGKISKTKRRRDKTSKVKTSKSKRSKERNVENFLICNKEKIRSIYKVYSFSYVIVEELLRQCMYVNSFWLSSWPRLLNLFSLVEFSLVLPVYKYIYLFLKICGH